jgi:hypothetical protein
MDKTRNAREIIKLMQESEKGFAKLYIKYSQIFPNKEFWVSLANDETNHAQWLAALAKSHDVEAIDAQIAPPAFIKVMNKSMLEVIASTKEISLKEALTKAKNLENTFLENNYFAVFRGLGRPFRDTIEKLISETEIHRDKIIAELAKME